MKKGVNSNDNVFFKKVKTTTIFHVQTNNHENHKLIHYKDPSFIAFPARSEY